MKNILRIRPIDNRLIYNHHDDRIPSSVPRIATMPPNLEDNHLKRPPSGLIMYISPLPLTGPLSDDDTDEETVTSDPEDDVVADPERVVVPLDYNLSALLVKVTGTEDLARITHLKLRVIARDIPLQHLNFHIPALRELILDGSVISSLRDLGCGLKNLKILKVNRCGLESLDNMLGLQSLEELHAADNLIENCTSCALLHNIRVLDFSNNKLKHVTRTLTFLTVCEKLERIYLQGNDEIWQFPRYRQTVKSLLPALRSLDGVTYAEEECNWKVSPAADLELQKFVTQKAEETQQLITPIVATNSVHTPRSRSSQVSNTGFSIRFPPKVFLNKPTNDTM